VISVNGLRGPRIFSGALVFVNPDSTTPQVIPFQYNPSRETIWTKEGGQK